MAESIDIGQLTAQLQSIYDNAIELESRYADDLAAVDPDFRDGALNLVHYLALRQTDIFDLQESLAVLGLSSLDRVERDVLSSIRAVLAALTSMSPGSGGDSHGEFYAPEPLRISVKNFFQNLSTPVRFLNAGLQGKFRAAGTELTRFFTNTTLGIGGLFDPAKEHFGQYLQDEDTGQTLGYYGAGGGFYINWPFLGPSNFRDSLGMVGDSYLHPYMYLDADWEVPVGVRAFEEVNHTALTLGDYELFTETALDPYAAVKDAYQQYRKGLIENK